MHTFFSTQHGDQRRIHVQLIKNKRRLKRKRKKRKKSTKPLEDRVISVLQYGKIKDYTHPKDVDPFWGVLYRQYEFLVYMDIYYRNTLTNSNVYLDDTMLLDTYNSLTYIQEQIQLLLTYMMNFMNVLYGSVIQSRFYGWKYYIDEFVSKFNEVAIVSLRKLKFNVDQTHCSVYFYQAFWLSGLAITNKISDDLKKNYSDESELNRGNAHLVADDTTTEELYEEYGSDALYNLASLHEDNNPIKEVHIPRKQAKDTTCPSSVPDTVACTHNEDYEIFCTLKKLLHQVGMSNISIYDLSNKKLLKLGRLIKKKLKNGEIVLQDADKELLVKFFKSPLLL